MELVPYNINASALMGHSVAISFPSSYHMTIGQTVRFSFVPFARRSFLKIFPEMAKTARLKDRVCLRTWYHAISYLCCHKSLQIAHGSHPLTALFSMSAWTSASDPSGWSLSARTAGSHNPGCPAPR